MLLDMEMRLYQNERMQRKGASSSAVRFKHAACCHMAALPTGRAMLALLAAVLTTRADGIYRNGASARSMALGGSDVALPEEPMDALHSNPAGLLALRSPTLQFGGVAALASGEFASAAGGQGGIRERAGAAPDFGVGFRLPDSPVAVGLGVLTDGALGARWNYLDVPGGLGGATSYGLQKHRSEIAVLRGALGIGVAISERLSLGASLGLIYNRNTLQAPYTFQSHPVLQGFKTLLDLRTEGFGVNGTAGVQFKPDDRWSFGLSYRTETRVDSDGDASGNAAAQLQSLGGAFAGVRPDFHYDATVANTFPQTVSAGVSWQFAARARAVIQLDWIGWSDAFDDLNISLTRGNNADLNAFLGTDSIRDSVPLHWRDAFVYRAGLEFAATSELALRVGYSFGENPVPASSLSPLTAAILEHTLTAGVGWERGRFSVDLAYQFDFPTTERVGVSGLRGGEYSFSRTGVEAHWIGLTTTIRF